MSKTISLDVSQLKPPPSIDRIISFLHSIPAVQDHLTTDFASRDSFAIGQIGQSAVQFSGRVAGRSSELPISSSYGSLIQLAQNYSLAGKELQELTKWLIHISALSDKFLEPISAYSPKLANSAANPLAKPYAAQSEASQGPVVGNRFPSPKGQEPIKIASERSSMPTTAEPERMEAQITSEKQRVSKNKTALPSEERTPIGASRAISTLNKGLWSANSYSGTFLSGLITSRSLEAGMLEVNRVSSVSRKLAGPWSNPNLSVSPPQSGFENSAVEAKTSEQLLPKNFQARTDQLNASFSVDHPFYPVNPRSTTQASPNRRPIAEQLEAAPPPLSPITIATPDFPKDDFQPRLPDQSSISSPFAWLDKLGIGLPLLRLIFNRGFNLPFAVMPEILSNGNRNPLGQTLTSDAVPVSAPIQSTLSADQSGFLAIPANSFQTNPTGAGSENTASKAIFQSGSGGISTVHLTSNLAGVADPLHSSSLKKNVSMQVTGFPSSYYKSAESLVADEYHTLATGNANASNSIAQFRSAALPSSINVNEAPLMLPTQRRSKLLAERQPVDGISLLVGISTTSSRAGLPIKGKDATPSKSRVVTSDPNFGQITLISPSILVASPEVSATGSAVEFGIKTMTAGATMIDQNLLSTMNASLPGLQAIYPALPSSQLGPSAVNMPLDPTMIGGMLAKGYGATPDIALKLASLFSGSSPSKVATSQPLVGSLVPKGRPESSATSILPVDSEDPIGALGVAGQKQATRGGLLNFLGLPVKLAPSLVGKPQLADQIQARTPAISKDSGTTRPAQFAALRKKLFPNSSTASVEPNLSAWQKAGPSYGLRDTSPTTLLSPDARVRPIITSAPKPQRESGVPISKPYHSPYIPRDLKETRQPTLAKSIAQAHRLPAPVNGSPRIGARSPLKKDLGHLNVPSLAVERGIQSAKPIRPIAVTNQIPPQAPLTKESPHAQRLRKAGIPKALNSSGPLGRSTTSPSPRMGLGNFYRSSTPASATQITRTEISPSHSPKPSPQMTYKRAPESRNPIETPSIQKSVGGVTTAAIPSSARSPKPVDAQAPKNDGADELAIMAREVWSLLKRRISAEADRGGRW